MAIPDVVITTAPGVNPSPSQNFDGVGALQLYGTAPGTFGTTACQAVFSLSDAVAKGIALDYADETLARAIYTVSGSVTIGDTFAVVITEKNPVTVDNPTGTTVITIGTATVSTAATATGAATDIAAMINAGTYSHKYTATSALGVVTLIARPGTGIMLNPAVSTTPLAVTVVGTATGVITQQFGTGSGGATAGVYSAKAIWYYQVRRFFEKSPNGKLWINFTAAPGAAFAEAVTLMTAAGGEPRYMGILNFVTKTAGNVTTDLNLLQAQYALTYTAKQPVEILYVPNIKAISDLSTLNNLQSTATAKNCLPIISQDGAAVGAQLAINSGVAVSNIGAILGTTSIAAVSQDIGEVGVFNLSDGSEDNVPAFTNGTRVSAVATSLLNTLDSYRYMFCVNYTGYPGTYINNDWTAIVQTNTYNRLSLNRTINKLVRGQYLALLPLLKSRIYLNADGTIDTITINKYLAASEPQIIEMTKDGDLSPGNISGTALTTGVVQISNTQNVRSQGYISITYNVLAVNIADSIQVTLQFTQKL